MKIALLGFGTVGVGVYEMLRNDPELECRYVLVRPGKERESFMVSDIRTITGDPSVDAVAEVMGGLEPAFSYACAALRAGKHFITSNKALVAAHGPELSALAQENGCAFLFSAACGGAVPFLHNLVAAAVSDSIRTVGGILNGTTNYMLDAVQRRGMSYDEALRDAQALGYAEADPTADVSGLDSLRKIMLAAAVAYRMLPTEGFALEGIESFTAEDAAALRERRLICRLVGEALPCGDTVSALVEPVLFPESAVECGVLTNFNLARYEGENCGPMYFIGQGAGRYPTASAVVRDLLFAARGVREMLPAGCRRVRADCSHRIRRYYLRVSGCIEPLPVMEEAAVRDGVLRGFTGELSVSEMHGYISELRQSGKNVFFAAIGE